MLLAVGEQIRAMIWASPLALADAHQASMSLSARLGSDDRPDVTAA
jgi:hypothetical protein